MSNHRYNGDPNQYMGGHTQSPHHSQQHGHHPHNAHLGMNGAINGHSHAQGHSPTSAVNMNLMDNVMDSVVHRRTSYNNPTMANHGHSHSSFPYPNHAINTHNGHPHNLVHASSSSLSTLSPSMSTLARPSSSSNLNNSHHNSIPIIVHDHDVLSGRGVNIAQHPGNQRFRTLITTFQDQEYCTTYSAGEKRAVALQIIKHIKDLDPPGRFLKRDGRGQGSRGLSGPWDELSERESIKKTCQALRDCNRQDRHGYAKGVAAPGDVLKKVQEANHIPAKERAAAAAHAIATEATTNALNAISVAASTNSCTVARAPETTNDSSSSVSITSSNKRSREEANSSTNTSTVAEVVESSATSSTNYSSPSSYYNAQQYHPTDHLGRFAAQTAAANAIIPSTAYQLAAPQNGNHYQQHHPYSSLQQHATHQQQHASQYQMNMSSYANASNMAAGFPSPAAASPYYQTNAAASDYLMPMAAAQAPTPFQEQLLSSIASTTKHNSNPHNHLQHHNSYYNTDPYSSTHNNYLHNSLHINHEDQVIKKQRTEDTDPSTGPSEPSPLNGNSMMNAATNDNQNNIDNGNITSSALNGGTNATTLQARYGHPDENGNLTNGRCHPVTTPSNSIDAVRNANGSSNNNVPHNNGIGQVAEEVPDAIFQEVEGENIVGNNEVSSWVTEHNNSSSMDNGDHFHDTLSNF
jgi:hypothetical protein